MIIGRLLMRFLLVPLGGGVAICVATLFVMVAQWNRMAALTADDYSGLTTFFVMVPVLAVGSGVMLWPATLGYTLRNFWNPIDSATTLISDDSLEQLRAWATRYLRPGGPLSALRIGKQPYGILPVSARGMLPLANSPLERELSQAIDWFRVQWDRVLSKVPTLRNPSPESLHQVLAMQPWPVAKRFWQVACPLQRYRHSQSQRLQ